MSALYWDLVVAGQPQSKTRAARGCKDGGATDAQSAMAERMRAVLPPPLTSGGGIDAVFYRSTLQRVDVDNLMKFILDAATGALWVDDSQVVKLSGCIELDRDDPRTVIRLWECSTSMPRGVEADIVKPCQTCGAMFTTRAYPSSPAGVYCSRDCMQRPDATCEECGTVYRKNSRAQRFCSRRCAAASKETRAKLARAARRRTLPLCRRCGTQLRRRGAYLCKPCWLSRGPDGMKGVSKADLRALEDTEPEATRAPHFAANDSAAL